MPYLTTLAALLHLAVEDRTQLALENIALRQQVAVLKRGVKRPRLRRRDRLFWVLLRRPRPCSNSAQWLTRYFVLDFGWTREFVRPS